MNVPVDSLNVKLIKQSDLSVLTEDPISSDSDNDEEIERGKVQPKGCKDCISAVAFLGQMLIIAVIAGIYYSDQDNLRKYDGYLNAILTLGLLNLVLVTLILRLMIEFGEYLVLMLLGFFMSFGIILIDSSRTTGAIFGLLLFGVSLTYTIITWKKIPAATATLITAVTVLRENFGIIYICYIFVIASFAWTLLWSLAVIVAIKASTYYVILCIFSYIWTYQVIVNIVTVASAHLVGKWWFHPEESNVCLSLSVIQCFKHAAINSFGSICMGALFTPYIQTTNEIFNPNGDVTACCNDNYPNNLGNLVIEFSRWSYIYVGVYGYSFREAGLRVKTSFKNRGWSPIVKDKLLRNIMFLLIMTIALIMGEAGRFLESNTSWFDEAGKSSELVAMVFGVCIGLVVGNVMMAVFVGSCLSVLTLYAEARDELRRNHAELDENMYRSFSRVYPSIILNSY